MRNQSVILRNAVYSILAASIAVSAAHAKTVVLKSGKEIVGDIIKETDKAVVISKNGGSFVFSIARDTIATIRESTGAEMRTTIEQKSNKTEEEQKTVLEQEKARREKYDKERLALYHEQVESANKARGRVKIPFVEGRPGVVAVKINNKVTANLFLDTGASLVVISKDLALRLGLDVTKGKGRIPVVLANGSVDTAIAITLDSVEVGSSKVKNVDAAISENPPGGDCEGLLGMTYLGNFHVRVDSKEQCVILEKY